jgi:hypothetical protein
MKRRDFLKTAGSSAIKLALANNLTARGIEIERHIMLL